MKMLNDVEIIWLRNWFIFYDIVKKVKYDIALNLCGIHIKMDVFQIESYFCQKHKANQEKENTKQINKS